MSENAKSNDLKFQQLVSGLEGSSRRERQQAAASLAVISTEHPDILLACGDQIVAALNNPEARTRWECLDILTNLVDIDSRLTDKAVVGAEASLFDEESGPVRLSAMRFLCKLGATTENRSEKIWPLIDEAIQCYHGDLEFQDMLVAVIDFSNGKLAPHVKEGLCARMKFDAENGKGALKRRASQIVGNVSAS